MVSSHKKYAEQGIGFLYEYGDGVPQDCKIAIEFYNSSQEHGNQFVSYHIGLMYFYGKGVEIDYKKAFDLFTCTKALIWKTSEKRALVHIREYTFDDGVKTERLYSYINQEFIIVEASKYLRYMLYHGYGTLIQQYVKTESNAY